MGRLKRCFDLVAGPGIPGSIAHILSRSGQVTVHIHCACASHRYHATWGWGRDFG